MEQLNRLILLLMTIVCATQATIIQTFYDKVESGQNITGIIVAELTTRSRIQCSNRLVMYKTLLLLYLVDWAVSFHDLINSAKKSTINVKCAHTKLK